MMDKEQLKQEIKDTIDFLRDHDPKVCIAGEDVLKKQIDNIIDKHIQKYFPEGYVLVSQKEYEDYLKKRERTKADFLSDLTETLNALENIEYPKKDRLCIFEPNGLAAYVDLQIGKAKAQARKEMVREVLKKVDDESNGQTIMVTNYIRKKYGVEVE